MRLFASSDRDYVSVNTLSRVIEKAQDLTGCRKAVDCEGDDPHRGMTRAKAMSCPAVHIAMV